ncbi:class I SAM-dependent methyltransferase [Streptomyces sp. NBC_00365]|uniref:class I SAM-dependent methyltransferase n=1 Tax=Streptomyces sp. NBC_00365 TaxID=2975726 RepID=UPI0022502105|nr:class I SAM-dependent methyltransferase [Streptomyces sp. NBC_00365]MCX5090339.1 class I SAM-dependent methyltransferase [Streptomyces sp. NBC_00365]
MREKEIAEFWSAHPCGDHLVGGASRGGRCEYEEFFTRYDTFKYRLEPHIPGCLDGLDVAGRRVLEIGLGQGAESEQLIRRGALWTGVDLTETSVERVRTRLTQRNLPWEGLHRANVLDLPFPADSFDLVFSHGVLHHVPDIMAAQREIHRVLRPGGELVAMLYARWSLNYLLSIGLLRRAALAVIYPLARAGLFKPSGVVGAHVRNARRAGLCSYLRMRQFIHHNTDGPDNPHSRVYDVRTARQHFPDFSLVRVHKHFMHAPPLPVHALPGGRVAGWHLWVHMRPKWRTDESAATSTSETTAEWCGPATKDR